MVYQKVGNRCAFKLIIPDSEFSEKIIIEILFKNGFEIINTDILGNARELIGKSRYTRGARMSEAPIVVDCSSLIKWLYGIRGIWLPRNLFLWQELGTLVDVDKSVGGDIVFTTDINRMGVNHVGLVSESNTVIHATNYVGIEEISFNALLEQRSISAIRRIIPKNAETVTLLLPVEEEIETSDDIEWLVRNSLSRQRK